MNSRLQGAKRVLAQAAPDVVLMDFAPSLVSFHVRWRIAAPQRAVADAIRHVSGSRPSGAEGE